MEPNPYEASGEAPATPRIGVNSAPVQILRWLLVVTLVAVGLWLIGPAYANWWASDVPPHDHDEYYRWWGNVFCGSSALSFVIAGGLFWVLRPRRFGHGIQRVR